MNNSSTNDLREKARAAFLTEAGWGRAQLAPLAADASSRSYIRLQRGGENLLLMDAPPNAESPICPPDADATVRQKLGYNAQARLAGSRLDAFSGIADWLLAAGVTAPKVYATNTEHGFALIDDFGDVLLKDRCKEGASVAPMYRAALAELEKVWAKPVTHNSAGAWPLLTYDAIALQAEVNLLPEFYAPHYAQALTTEAIGAWTKVWQNMFTTLSAPSVMVLRDYHAENILIRDSGALAVIDFQDALIGQPTYDVASLLEDARRDVDLGLAAELLDEIAARQPDTKAFITDYAVLALQRNMKILGVFARLIHRDKKPKYKDFFPRVKAHVARDLARDDVAPIRAWAERYMPDLLIGSAS